MRITLSTGTPAELARPSPGPSARGLVLLPDIGGLRPLFDEHARKLAEENQWTVVVPEPWPGREGLSLEQRLGEVASLRDDDKAADALAAAEATECDDVGIAGFCMGGMYAMKAAASGRFDAAVSFYGMIRMPEAWRSPHQADAIELVAAPGACPVLALCGTDDPWLPSAEVDELKEVATVVRYEGADHAFAQDPERDTFRPKDAADAWGRAIAFLGGRPGRSGTGR